MRNDHATEFAIDDETFRLLQTKVREREAQQKKAQARFATIERAMQEAKVDMLSAEALVRSAQHDLNSYVSNRVPQEIWAAVYGTLNMQKAKLLMQSSLDITSISHLRMTYKVEGYITDSMSLDEARSLAVGVPGAKERAVERAKQLLAEQAEACAEEAAGYLADAEHAQWLLTDGQVTWPDDADSE